MLTDLPTNQADEATKHHPPAGMAQRLHRSDLKGHVVPPRPLEKYLHFKLDYVKQAMGDLRPWEMEEKKAGKKQKKGKVSHTCKGIKRFWLSPPGSFLTVLKAKRYAPALEFHSCHWTEEQHKIRRSLFRQITADFRNSHIPTFTIKHPVRKQAG